MLSLERNSDLESNIFIHAAEERHLAATARGRDQQIENGVLGAGVPVNFVSGNGDGVMPPDYHQPTQHSTSRAR